MTADQPRLRYREEGNVHLDFHGAAATTINFIVARFGTEALHDIFRHVARDVYQDLRAHLLAGDSGEVVRHWQHFFTREGADFDIAVGEDEIVMTVRHCPAWHHVARIHGAVPERFCDQTSVVNTELAEGTPFAIDTVLTGPGACRQIIRRRT